MADAHTCHARGCERTVPPKMFMCKSHWFSLPKEMRDAIWAEYVPRQEVRKDPTPEYLNIAWRAVRWLAIKEGRIDAVSAGGSEIIVKTTEETL